jgi:serine protease
VCTNYVSQRCSLLCSNHPDIPCLPIDDENTNCVGAEFGLGLFDGLWHNPIKRYHGTHVAGVIGARGDNGFGVQGIIPDGNFCFLIGRVFGESGTGTKMSSIFAAVEWMVDHGANVINMSLGSGIFSSGGSPLMQSAYAEGVLLIAASGNAGTQDYHYPASFENVLSVAAVNEKQGWADFSQYNDGVDIAAPGVEILSTFPTGSGEVVLITYEEFGAIGEFMKNSVDTDNFSGTLIDCPNFGQEKCPGNGGHVCLIERYAKMPTIGYP